MLPMFWLSKVSSIPPTLTFMFCRSMLISFWLLTWVFRYSFVWSVSCAAAVTNWDWFGLIVIG